ncbi:MAG: 4-hydroxy-tetrahydrodipicolinate reductase [Dehalococcoidia bacterium]|nr:4-hydroxy-tetrahydrodipicolinate reductase [Dehalococcoidia bacterium]
MPAIKTLMPAIKVIVTGASGKMSREVLTMLCGSKEFEPVGAVSRWAAEDYLSLPDGSGLVPLSPDLETIIQRCRPDVLVDFTNAEYSLPAARAALKNGVRPVIGTSGLAPTQIDELKRLSHDNKVGCVIAPNFALGAVVMIKLAKFAAPFFDHVEIIEMHHDQKVDAPSGTAIATARDMAAARGKPFTTAPTLKENVPGPRASQVEGVVIHSLRLPGLMAHQEVVFGGQGQTLRIRHDTLGRECYMPGVAIAIKEVVKLSELVYGLDMLLGL